MTTTISTKDQFENLVNRIAILQTQRTRIATDRDAQINAITVLAAESLDPLDDQIAELLQAAETFADQNRELLFGTDKKSAETALCDYGFRKGNPTLKLINSKWKWERVVTTLQAKKMQRFIRMKPEPDKDAMKTDLTTEQLKALGCEIDQKETFWAEPKVETGDRVTTEGKAVA